MLKQPAYWFVFLFLFCLSGFAQTVDQDSDRVQTNTSTFPKPNPIESKAEYKPHLGLIAGAIDPEGSYDPGFGYGLDIGFQPYIPFGVGLELTKSESNGRRQNEDIEQTALLLKGTYNFGGSNFLIRNSYAGIALGEVTKPGHSDIAGAPLVGFDMPIKEKAHNYLTLGLNAKYLLINGDDPDVLAINGAVKYWY